MNKGFRVMLMFRVLEGVPVVWGEIVEDIVNNEVP